MRIAYVCADPGVPVFGNKGCSIHVQEIVRAMLACGHDVELFVARRGGSVPPGLESCRVHEMPIPHCAETRDRENQQSRWGDRVVQELKQHQPFELVYERHALWSASALRWARGNGVPSVLEVNAPLIDEQSQHRKLVQRHLASEMTRQAMRAASMTYAVSDEIVPYCKQYLGANQHAPVIPNGVNTSRFSPSVSPALESDAFTIGFVGTLKPWHGLDDLLEAYSRFCSSCGSSDSRLLIVGEGPQRSAIESWLEQRPRLRLRVHLTGGVDSDQVPAWLTSMDVAVVPYPSLPHCYFSPLKMFEYMAAGRPIVASSTGQVRDVLQHGVNGLLYPPGEVVRLSKAMLELKENISLRTAIGRAARASSRSCDWHHVLDKIFSFAGIHSQGRSVSSIPFDSHKLHDELQA